QNLRKYPVPQVDFAGIAADFSALKARAIANGRYLARTSTGTSKTSAGYWNGYRLIFNGNGTVTVRRVTATTALSSTHINPGDDSLPDRTLIASDTFHSTISIPESCPLIFVED